MDYRNIILTGFMGSGKSSIGKCLATKLSLSFVETDTELLHNSTYATITEMVAKKGEPYFRKLEREALVTLLKKSNQVISLGGGTICQDGITALFHPEDYIIYLDVPFEECARRIKEQEKDHTSPRRPLFQNETSARELFVKREAIYKNSSQLHVPAESGTPDEIASIIHESTSRKG
jgi:shikimate kinase